MNVKHGDIKITLKHDGFKSELFGKVSEQQWLMINKILLQKDDNKLFTYDEMIDFGTSCLIRNSERQNGTIKDYLELFINENR